MASWESLSWIRIRMAWQQHEDKDKWINVTIFYLISIYSVMNPRPKIKTCHQVQRWAQFHLEHDQVVVMPLYLEDVGQSHHPCFEIWRINCKTQMRDDLMFHLKQSGQSAWTGRGAERFYWPSRLMRGSAALLLAAASGSQFLYLSTEERHETHPHVHWILACHVDIKVILNTFFNLISCFVPVKGDLVSWHH